MSFDRKYLGHGVGLRNKHYSRWLSEKPQVDWVEVISENFMSSGGRPLAVLEKVRRDVPVVLHGVSLSIGSTDPLSVTYLANLRNLAARIEPEWVSDHLCWGSHGGRYGHDLWPLPFTEETVDHVVRRVRIVQDVLKRQILLENVSSYINFESSTMTEWEFLNEVVERADCGILLDVNNIYVSSQNHSFDPFTYVNSVPAERVAQIHIAGHSKYRKYILDTHDHPVIDPVWKLYERAIQRAGHTATLLEWDDSIPSFQEVHNEALKANRFLSATLLATAS